MVLIFNQKLEGTRSLGGEKHKPGFLTSEEVSFLLRMTQHKNLQSSQAVKILVVLATVYITKPTVAKAILPTISSLIEKHWGNQKLRDFVERVLIPKALSTILDVKREESVQKTPYQTKSQLAIQQDGR